MSSFVHVSFPRHTHISRAPPNSSFYLHIHTSSSVKLVVNSWICFSVFGHLLSAGSRFLPNHSPSPWFFFLFLFTFRYFYLHTYFIGFYLFVFSSFLFEKKKKQIFIFLLLPWLFAICYFIICYIYISSFLLVRVDSVQKSRRYRCDHN